MIKNITILCVVLLVSLMSFAQQGINYKALIKDTNGNALVNANNLTVQFTIFEGVALTNAVYQETHSNASTDANGILILILGNGTTTDMFTDISWGNDEHWLNVQIDVGAGLVDISTTQFMAVPYALEASNVTGLEAIDEGNGIGHRIKGRNPANYGNIGSNAIDLSYRISSSFNDNGATGPYATAMGQSTTASADNSTAMGGNTVASDSYATAMGLNTTASGYISTAMGSFTVASGNRSLALGNHTTASGDRSVAMGSETTAPSVSETTIGQLNTDYTVSSSGNILWNPTDRLFTVGNGQFNANSDALIILKNGTITAPSLDLEEITNNKSLITKEYLEATTSLPSGLEKITEFENSGWRLIGQDPGNYRNVGLNAIDLSFSDTPSTILGAWGECSVAMGFQTLAADDYSTSIGYRAEALNSFSMAFGTNTNASGNASTAMGVFTTASGDLSIAIGNTVTAPSFSEIAIGSYNTNYTPSSSISRVSTDRLFSVGNGTIETGSLVRSNALTILKNGKVGIGRDIPSSLLEVAHQNSPPTSSNYTNSLSIHNIGTGRSWQLHTVGSHHLNLYRNGNYRGYFHEATGVYSSISDRRTKKDITALENGTLSKVMQLNPVSYLMKDQTDTKRNMGLISQEVQEIFPSITNYVEESDLITLSYTELIPILIKALQEQQEVIEGQNNKIDGLHADNSSLKTSLSNLISRVEKIEANNQ